MADDSPASSKHHVFSSWPSFAGVPTRALDDLGDVGVVEVSPPYDGPGQITAYLANRVVLEILNGMAELKIAEHA